MKNYDYAGLQTEAPSAVRSVSAVLDARQACAVLVPRPAGTELSSASASRDCRTAGKAHISGHTPAIRSAITAYADACSRSRALAGRSRDAHLMLLQLCHKLHAFVDEAGLRQHAGSRCKMPIVVVEHQLVDVDLADSCRDAFPCQVVGKSVGPVEHDAHSAVGLLVNRSQSSCRRQLCPLSSVGLTHLARSSCGPLGPYSPCTFPTAGARKSTPVATNSSTSSGVVKIPDISIVS